MRVIGTVAGSILILLILIDCFETILQPRRVTHRFRYARVFYRTTWTLWRAFSAWVPAGSRRESFLGIFGPLSLLGLFATWMVGLVLGFGLCHWGLGSAMRAPDESVTLVTYFYLSGTTFFTLGYGDITPTAALGRALAVIESGLGFGFLAVVIGYVPVLYQAFSRREVTISLLDARAGSPPSAAQLLLRLGRANDIAHVDVFLAEWEQWAAELLESQLSFPVLSYYRSQHDNQSWVAALTSMLDTCALLLAGVKGHNPYQAQLTFAMARHAAVDLSLVLKAPPKPPSHDRLPSDKLRSLQAALRPHGVHLSEGPEVESKLAELRGMYEPFIAALARRFLFALPSFVPDEAGADNWQRSAWMRRTPDIASLPLATVDDEHFQ